VKNKRGQIWVETVIYTLMGVVIISLALAFIKPKIEEIQDKGIIDQSLNLIKYIDEKISEMKVSGNVRIVNLEVKKGEFVIDGKSQQLFFEIETPHSYSELDQNVEI